MFELLRTQLRNHEESLKWLNSYEMFKNPLMNLYVVILEIAYLIPLNFRAPFIFAPLIFAPQIFAHPQNSIFRAPLIFAYQIHFRAAFIFAHSKFSKLKIIVF